MENRKPNPVGDTSRAFHIEQGCCHVLFAYDAARSINLDEAVRHIREVSERQTIRHKRRTPSHFEYEPPPLRVSYDGEPLVVGSFLDDWDSSILRKLQTLDSIYRKLSDQATTRRMEILEWIIIALIAVSIVIELIRYNFL